MTFAYFLDTISMYGIISSPAFAWKQVILFIRRILLCFVRNAEKNLDRKQCSVLIAESLSPQLEKNNKKCPRRIQSAICLKQRAMHFMLL